MSKEFFVKEEGLRYQANRFSSEQKLAEELEANINLAKVLASSQTNLLFYDLAEGAERLAVFLRELSEAADNLCDELEYTSSVISEQLDESLLADRKMHIM